MKDRTFEIEFALPSRRLSHAISAVAQIVPSGKLALVAIGMLDLAYDNRAWPPVFLVLSLILGAGALALLAWENTKAALLPSQETEE